MPTFSIAARLRSIGYALEGMKALVASQHNAWIHFAATLAVVAAGFWFAVSGVEWLALILAIALVWCTEALNTAFEALCDVASPEHHPMVKRAKDIAAAAVLIATIGAVAVGLVVFGPRVLEIFA